MNAIQKLTVSEAFAAVQSAPCGLSEVEAERRLAQVGLNRVASESRDGAWRAFFRGFTHFLALILWVAAALAFFFERREPGSGMAMLGWGVIAVILINGVFSFWQEYRAGKALAALQALLPDKVKVRRDSKMTLVCATRLVPGDVVLLQAGDTVPAECRVVTAGRLRVNNAAITGESMPHSRDAVPTTEDNLLSSRNILLAGTSVVAGEATALVFATRANTAFGRIARLTQESQEPPSPLQREIRQLSKFIALFAAVLGAVFFGIGRFIGLSFWQNFMFAIGILIANVPEGLLPTITLALALASQRMARRNAIVRRLPCVETLGAATVICTDKTGTLTEGRMTVAELHAPGGASSFSPRCSDRGVPLDRQAALTVMALCHSLSCHGAQWMGDPLDLALFLWAQQEGAFCPECRKLGEIGFDSARKRMSTLHEASGGLLLCCKGAPEIVLERCARWASGEEAARFFSSPGQQLESTASPGREMTTAEREMWLQKSESMARLGMRVLALALKRTTEREANEDMERDLQFAGLVGLRDPTRPEVPAAIEKCRAAGVKVIMVTGDHPLTALAVAREAGLIRSELHTLIQGDDLSRMKDDELMSALDAPELIFARVAAEQKLQIVLALQRKGNVVAATGDGVNDAPALKQADIGIAMGRGGTDVARSAADLILLDDNFATIVAAIEEGRAVYANIRKFLTYILTSNIPEMVPYLAFILFRIPLPLTVIQILAVDLGTDMLPALALGAERARPDAMLEPPRPRLQRLVNWSLVTRAYGFLGVFEAAAAMAAFFFVLRAGAWSYGEPLAFGNLLYREATTACLSAVVLMQAANLFLCRSANQSIFSLPNPFANRLITAGLVFEALLILFIVYMPWGNALFGTAPIGASVWLFVAPFAALLVFAEEARKWVSARMRREERGATTKAAFLNAARGMD